MREKNKRKNRSLGHTDALFLTHSILLKKFQWDDFNHTLKDHQISLILIMIFFSELIYD
jgi:hypothetical protein